MVIDGVTGRDIADSYSIPRQQEVIYLSETKIHITAVKIANDGHPLIYAQEVGKNGKDLQANSGRDGQNPAGENNEGLSGNVGRKGHDGHAVFDVQGVSGGSETFNGVPIQQSGHLQEEVKHKLSREFNLEELNKETTNNIKLRGGVIVNTKVELDHHIATALNGSKKVSPYIGAITEATKSKIEGDIGTIFFKKPGQYSYSLS